MGLGMAPRPIKVRIEAEGPEAESFIALARSEGLVLAEADEAADLVAHPARMPARRMGDGGAAPPPMSRREASIWIPEQYAQTCTPT